MHLASVGLDGPLNMAHIPGMGEHCGNCPLVVLPIMPGERIPEIRKRTQVGAAHFFDYIHDKEGVFCDRIVVLEIDDYVSLRPVFG